MEIDLHCKNKFCIVLYLKVTRFHDDQWTITQIAGKGKSCWIIICVLPRGSARVICSSGPLWQWSPSGATPSAPSVQPNRGSSAPRLPKLHTKGDILGDASTPPASPHSCPTPCSEVLKTPPAPTELEAHQPQNAFTGVLLSTLPVIVGHSRGVIKDHF